MFTSGDFDPENDYNFDTVFEEKQLMTKMHGMWKWEYHTVL